MNAIFLIFTMFVHHHSCNHSFTSNNTLSRCLSPSGDADEPSGQGFISMKKIDRVGYENLHIWVKKNYGKPTICEMCNNTIGSKRVEWASRNHVYTRNREDWLQLCTTCHKRYDHQVKPVVKMNNDLVVIEKYESVIIASKQTGISTSSIYEAIRTKKRGGNVRGNKFYWKYANDNNG